MRHFVRLCFNNYKKHDIKKSQKHFLNRFLTFTKKLLKRFTFMMYRRHTHKQTKKTKNAGAA